MPADPASILFRATETADSRLQPDQINDLSRKHMLAPKPAYLDHLNELTQPQRMRAVELLAARNIENELPQLFDDPASFDGLFGTGAYAKADSHVLSVCSRVLEGLLNDPCKLSIASRQAPQEKPEQPL